MERVLIFKDIKNKRWTIWSTDRKKHIGYADELFLVNAEFVVIAEQSQKIKKTGKRFPHAWVIGELSHRSFSRKIEVVYNPFTMSSFSKLGGKSVTKSKQVHLSKLGKVFV